MVLTELSSGVEWIGKCGKVALYIMYHIGVKRIASEVVHTVRKVHDILEIASKWKCRLIDLETGYWKN